MRTCIRIRYRGDDKKVGIKTIRDEMLGSVQHPAIAVTHSSGCDGGGVGPGRGLGEGHGKGSRATNSRQQICLNLRVGAFQQDFIHIAESAADQNITGATELLLGDHPVENRQTATTIFGRNIHRIKTKRLRLRPDLGGNIISKVTRLLDPRL